jgi:selenocysteine lyase/cysteine desulfurase
VEQALIEGLHALPADRGSTGQTTAERIFAIRVLAADLFGFRHPERVLFTPGATYGLNLAVRRGISDGSHVLTTASEHNSLLRPLHAAATRGVTFEVLPFAGDGRLDLEALGHALEAGNAGWLAMCIASNTLGVVQPYVEACRMAREAGVSVILDLSQGGGQVPVNLGELDVAYAAIAGHKGLYGPRGIGLLFVGAGQEPQPFLHGGTGTEGTMLEMPDAFPGHLEAGTSNYPGIFAMGAALNWIRQNPPDLGPLCARLSRLEDWCRTQPGLEVLPTEGCAWEHRLAVLSMRPKDFPAEMMVQYLAQVGISARAGSMCTTQVLPAVDAEDGLMRLSPPLDATDDDFARVRKAIEESLEAFA